LGAKKMADSLLRVGFVDILPSFASTFQNAVINKNRDRK
jgi:hypothetical protein